MKVAFYTLGCKVNQYETQAMEQQLLALGHVSGTDADDCDAYLINTCTVTAVADRKNRTLIRRLRREHVLRARRPSSACAAAMHRSAPGRSRPSA